MLLTAASEGRLAEHDPLRDEGEAAQILAHTLGASRFAGDLLLASPEAVQYLGEADGLRPRTGDQS